MIDNSRKLTLTLSQRDYDFIENLAQKYQLSKTDLIREGVGLVAWYGKHRDNGAQILAKQKDGTIFELEKHL